MQKQITQVFDGLTKKVDEGLQHMDLLIFFEVGGKKQPAIDSFTGVPNKVQAVECAEHWLEEFGGELCTAAEKALQYRTPSREVLALLDKLLPVGASMLTLAKDFAQRVAAAKEAKNDIDFTIHDINRMWIHFDHLRIVLLQAGLKVSTRKVRWP